MCDALLLCWHMTGDQKYLAPLRSMAAIRLEWLKYRDKNPKPGSAAWCGSEMGFLADTLVKYRLLSGSREFGELLVRDAGGMATDQLDPDDPSMVKSLERTAEALAINFPGRTSEVRWTDRVFSFSRMFKRDMLFPEEVPACNRRPDLGLLYATATGDRGDFLVFPLNRVRWLTEPREIAAIVTGQGPDRLAAELFHFGVKPRAMGAELYLLRSGKYRLTLVDEQNDPLAKPVPVEVSGPRTRVRFTLPPRTRCRLEVMPVEDG
jgi:hypothetical protein